MVCLETGCIDKLTMLLPLDIGEPDPSLKYVRGCTCAGRYSFEQFFLQGWPKLQDLAQLFVTENPY